MDKNIPFPECAKNCEVVKMLGVGECESVCGHKFDTSEGQLTIPDVVERSEQLPCKHTHIESSDGCDECVDCGARNY